MEAMGAFTAVMEAFMDVVEDFITAEGGPTLRNVHESLDRCFRACFHGKCRRIDGRFFQIEQVYNYAIIVSVKYDVRTPHASASVSHVFQDLQKYFFYARR